jgi:HPt (histidine-containing phosphotransfer) domain-containing protein
MSQRSIQPKAVQEPEPIEGIVNPDRAIERLGGSCTLYSNVVRRFLDDEAGNFALLRQAIVAHDAPLTKRSAHSLKGLAAMCGAESVHDALSSLENHDSAEEEASPAEMLSRVDSEMAIAKQVLKPYRDGSI